MHSPTVKQRTAVSLEDPEGQHHGQNNEARCVSDSSSDTPVYPFQKAALSPKHLEVPTRRGIGWNAKRWGVITTASYWAKREYVMIAVVLGAVGLGLWHAD
ncbi:hypothetical protein KIPB_010069 [Kipferlia bialata]|uniref:Uncharacterized protein n=1 Tax=Kipferlia bialata TaxID=797122 RepID=A0A9K3GM31_9EUKA|nr:hypothetical protein KIPB_010069 [Kipferlia bialata]|eukprot:g10069.t1